MPSAEASHPRGSLARHDLLLSSSAKWAERGEKNFVDRNVHLYAVPNMFQLRLGPILPEHINSAARGEYKPASVE